MTHRKTYYATDSGGIVITTFCRRPTTASICNSLTQLRKSILIFAVLALARGGGVDTHWWCLL